MAIELATAYVSLTASAKGIGKSISSEIGQEMSGPLQRAGNDAGQHASKSFGSKFTSGMATIGKAAAAGLTAGFAAAAGAGLFLKGAVDSASDLQESMSKNKAVFKDGAGAVQAWAETAARGFGQSTQQALEAAGTFGNLFQSFGVGQKPAQEMSTSLTELASDLASFNNTSVQDAIEALRSGLSGETEPLKRYGIALNDARLDAEALRLGIVKGNVDMVAAGKGMEAVDKATRKSAEALKEHGEGSQEYADALRDQQQAEAALAKTMQGKVPQLDAAQKAQAAYSLVMQSTALAQGDFERTSGGLANQQKILGAQFENLKAKVGTALLPIVTSAITKLNNLGDVFGTARKAIDFFVGGFTGEFTNEGSGFLLFVNQLGMKVGELVARFRQEWPRIKQIIQDALETAKIVIQGFITTVTVIWQNFGPQIIAFVTATWNQIKGTIEAALQIIRGIVQTITSLIRGDWQGVWEGIKQIVAGVWNGIVALATGFVGRVRAVLSVLLEILSSIFRAAWEGVRNATVTGITNAVNLIRQLPGKAVAALAGIGSALLGRGVELILGFISGITNRVEGYVSLIRGLPGKAIGALAGIGSALFSAGADLLRGFIDGIKSMAGRVADAALAPVRGAVNAVKGFLGIGSPSKLFRDIGLDTMKGLSIGLEQGHDIVVNQTIAPTVAHAAAFTPPAAHAGTGPVVITGNTFIGDGPTITKLLDARIREGRRAGVQFLGV